MKISRHFYTTSLLTACLVAGSPTFAAPDADSPKDNCQARQDWSKGKHHRGGPIGKIEHLSRRLDLSDEQQQQVQQLMEQAKPKFSALMDDMREQRKAFDQLLMADNPSRDQIEAAVDKQSNAMKQMMLEGAQVRADFFALLTPEQRDQAKTLMQKRRRF